MYSSNTQSRIKNYKLVFLGDSAVGKSCIVNRFSNDRFNDYQESTIGAAFSTAKININDKEVKFEIWDTAGQERYKSLAPMYYRGAKFAVVVYDITMKDSFNGAKLWIHELKNKHRNDCITILVGNKSDLKKDRQISEEEAKSYAENHDLEYIEVSAKSGENIKKIFHNLVNQLYERSEESIEDSHVNDISLEPEINRIDKKCC